MRYRLECGTENGVGKGAGQWPVMAIRHYVRNRGTNGPWKVEDVQALGTKEEYLAVDCE